jgi:predicted O-methyltransferase YrrM
MTGVAGNFTYCGTTIMQHKDVADAFRQLFLQTQPTRILEIGTASGGLTLLVRDLLDELNQHDVDILTYDNNPDHNTYNLRDRISKGAKIDFRIKNIFNHMYNDLIDVTEPSEFIQQSGVTIVLCDGGSKKNEFNILSKYLKDGDIIMAHDYAPNVEYFEENIRNKIWNWLEIQDSDIMPACNAHNLHPFLQKMFQNVVWACRIKRPV